MKSITRFKYLPTPFNLLAGYYISCGVISYVNMDWERAELGGLEPFVLWGIAIMAFGLDLILQLVMKKRYVFLYVSQFMLLLLYLLWLKDIGEI